MEKISYPGLQETLYREILPNGLPVLVVPKPGFTRKIAYFTTDYGAVHRTFTLNGQTYTIVREWSMPTLRVTDAS